MPNITGRDARRLVEAVRRAVRVPEQVPAEAPERVAGLEAVRAREAIGDEEVDLTRAARARDPAEDRLVLDDLGVGRGHRARRSGGGRRRRTGYPVNIFCADCSINPG
jgi:hypothetical protein